MGLEEAVHAVLLQVSVAETGTFVHAGDGAEGGRDVARGALFQARNAGAGQVPVSWGNL